MPLEAVLQAGPGGALTIVLRGELDLSEADALWRLLTRAVLRSPCLLLDLAEVTFLDCSILGVLVRARRVAEQSGGRLRISTCRPQVRRLLAITDLEEHFGLS